MNSKNFLGKIFFEFKKVDPHRGTKFPKNPFVIPPGTSDTRLTRTRLYLNYLKTIQIVVWRSFSVFLLWHAGQSACMLDSLPGPKELVFKSGFPLVEAKCLKARYEHLSQQILIYKGVPSHFHQSNFFFESYFVLYGFGYLAHQIPLL